jgi:glycosyltransferase involved in cell wall biosynthesis
MNGPTSSRNMLGNVRVLFVNQVLEMGGAERQALYLARYLKDDIGSEVHFWGLGRPGLAMERCREWGIPSRVVPVNWRGGMAGFAQGAWGFLAECRRLSPTIILPYTHPANVLCGLGWRSVGAGVCIWNQRDGGLHRLPRALERLAVRSTPWFVANSFAGAAFLRNDLGVCDGSVRVVRNGLPVVMEPVSREEQRRLLGIAKDDLVACMVANFHDGKDHETLIRAWSQVHKAAAAQGRDSTLLLAGHDYGKQTKLEAIAAELGLSPLDVRFVGQLNDPGPILGAADLCVHSTKSDESEGTPNAVLEAMGAGLSVVGTDVAGMRETLGESFRSNLSPPGDVDALAERILRFLLDERLRREAGRQNKRRARSLFSLGSMCTNMTNLIVSAMQERGIRMEGHSGLANKELQRAGLALASDDPDDRRVG